MTACCVGKLVGMGCWSIRALNSHAVEGVRVALGLHHELLAGARVNKIIPAKKVLWRVRSRTCTNDRYYPDHTCSCAYA